MTTHINNTLETDYEIYFKSEDSDYIDGNTLIKYNLTTPINVKEGLFMMMKVKTIEIPMGYYVLNENNDYLQININSINQSYTFTHGNPTAYNLQDFINDNFTNITATYNLYTNKIQLTSIYSFYITTTSTLNKLIGFTEDIQHNSTLISGSYYLESDLIVNVSGTKAIYLYSPTFHNSHMESGNNGLVDNTMVLLKIPTNTLFNGILYYENYNSTYVKCYIKSLSEIIYGLYDDNGDLLDLNGQDWSLSLSVSLIKID